MIAKIDSFIEYCLDVVDRHVVVMILGSLLLLCGRGFSQSIDCEKLNSWHEVCKFSDGSVSETFSGDSYSRFEWTGAEAKKVWSKALAHRTAERRRLEREIKELQDQASVENNTIIPKTKGGSLKETTQRMCEDAVKANKPLPSYCEPRERK